MAQALPSVFSSPSPLQALRAYPESLEGERGIKGVRVSLGGWGVFPTKPAPKTLDFYYTRAKLFHSSN